MFGEDWLFQMVKERVNPVIGSRSTVTLTRIKYFLKIKKLFNSKYYCAAITKLNTLKCLYFVSM